MHGIANPQGVISESEPGQGLSADSQCIDQELQLNLIKVLCHHVNKSIP